MFGFDPWYGGGVGAKLPLVTPGRCSRPVLAYLRWQLGALYVKKLQFGVVEHIVQQSARVCAGQP